VFANGGGSMMIGVRYDNGWVRSTTSISPAANARASWSSGRATNGSLTAALLSGRRLDSGHTKGPGELEPVLQQMQVHVEALRPDGVDLCHDARDVPTADHLSCLVAKVEDVGPATFHMDLHLLENRFEFARALRPAAT